MIKQNQIDELMYAFDIIRNVKCDIEGEVGHKRMAKHLDKALSEIQIVCERAYERKEGKLR